jgi:hypothetical protein
MYLPLFEGSGWGRRDMRNLAAFLYIDEVS